MEQIQSLAKCLQIQTFSVFSSFSSPQDYYPQKLHEKNSSRATTQRQAFDLRKFGNFKKNY